MTAFLLTLAFLTSAVVAAIILLAWTVAVTMREADLGGWFNE